MTKGRKVVNSGRRSGMTMCTEDVLIRGEHGGSVPLSILTDASWVKLIKYLWEDLGKRKSFRGGSLADEVRIGMNGVVVGDAFKMIEVTG